MKLFTFFTIFLLGITVHARTVECQSEKDYMLVELYDEESAELLEFNANIFPFSFNLKKSLELKPSSFRSKSLSFSSRISSSSGKSVTATFIFPKNIFQKKITKRRFKVEVDLFNFDNGFLNKALLSLKSCIVIK